MMPVPAEAGRSIRTVMVRMLFPKITNPVHALTSPSMIDRVFFSFLLWLVPGCVVAQYVGIDHRGIAQLKQLVPSDAGVKRLYDSLQQIADDALQSAPTPIAP